jgi:hypothetical protein
MFFICRLIDEVVIFMFFVTNLKSFKERNFPVLGKSTLYEGPLSVMQQKQEQEP